MKDYPIEHEGYRQTLNDNIFNFYSYWEIGINNSDHWLHELKSRMAIIMPKYNTLYKSVDLMASKDPLLTYEFWREFDHKGTAESNTDTTDYNDRTSDGTAKDVGNASSSSNGKTHDEGKNDGKSSSTSRDYISDTPQGNLWGSSNPDVESLQYLSQYNRNTSSGETHSTNSSDGTSENSSSSTSTNDNTTHSYEVGNAQGNTKVNSGDTSDDDTHEWGSNGGSYQDLVQKYRDLAINIDQQIIEELEELFFWTFDLTDLMDSCGTYGFMFPYAPIPCYPVIPWHMGNDQGTDGKPGSGCDCKDYQPEIDALKEEIARLKSSDYSQNEQITNINSFRDRMKTGKVGQVWAGNGVNEGEWKSDDSSITLKPDLSVQTTSIGTFTQGQVVKVRLSLKSTYIVEMREPSNEYRQGLTSGFTPGYLDVELTVGENVIVSIPANMGYGTIPDFSTGDLLCKCGFIGTGSMGITLRTDGTLRVNNGLSVTCYPQTEDWVIDSVDKYTLSLSAKVV